ncbi:MAG TPA: gamma-glutamyl-gamma-aminobutyrate hydrolase family protein [Acidimicrobiales bacterium]|nr:gamma-glutamyl-gamma-aminobutyrate hydrolase family protein [Acidimicrobiales bacterium]
MRPLIAVTTRLVARDQQQGTRADALVCSRRYLDAVRRAGGQEAAMLEVPLSDEEADEVVRRFDGLVLIGGADVDPAQYGAEAHPESSGMQADVDAFDIALARAAVRNGTPLLAICRGLQVLNVALGGTLTQHLPDVEGRDEHRNGVLHEVDLKPGSKAAKAMGTTRPVCSSFHHQAIERLAPGLVETGWADDGTIEAVEAEGDAWIVGVQWHPEDTAADDSSQQRLFDALIEQARS